jgi:hypothetical protein
MVTVEWCSDISDCTELLEEGLVENLNGNVRYGDDMGNMVNSAVFSVFRATLQIDSDD